MHVTIIPSYFFWPYKSSIVLRCLVCPAESRAVLGSNPISEGCLVLHGLCEEDGSMASLFPKKNLVVDANMASLFQKKNLVVAANMASLFQTKNLVVDATLVVNFQLYHLDLWA